MKNTKNLSIASVVAGVIGLIILGIPLGITAIILGSMTVKTTAGKVGIVLGVLDIAGVLWFMSLL